MDYLYCEDGNFEDFASGRVIYGGRGIPNFPVRLLNEIFGRARSHLDRQEGLTVYDPCCGGGYSLAVLGFFHQDCIARLCGSDVDEAMILHARKNLALLTKGGLEVRRAELERMHARFGRDSHREALESCARLEAMLRRDVPSEIFRADCTRPLPTIAPDLIITDVPYGNLVEWNDASALNLDAMLARLWEIAPGGGVLAVCMDRRQKCACGPWTRLEKHNIGKRRFEIFRKTETQREEQP